MRRGCGVSLERGGRRATEKQVHYAMGLLCEQGYNTEAVDERFDDFMGPGWTAFAGEPTSRWLERMEVHEVSGLIGQLLEHRVAGA